MCQRPWKNRAGMGRRISAPSGGPAVSRRRGDSCPSDGVVAGFFFDFEAILGSSAGPGGGAFEPGRRRVPGAAAGLEDDVSFGRRRREPVALSADGGGDPIGKNGGSWPPASYSVSGAAAGVVRAEPHGARGTDEARPPARLVVNLN